MYFNGAMPNPYDVALRERAVTAYERGDGSYADLVMSTIARSSVGWRAGVTPSPWPRSREAAVGRVPLTGRCFARSSEMGPMPR